MGSHRQRQPSGDTRHAGHRAKSTSRRCLTLRRDGHTYAFAYPPEHERAALAAFAGCPAVEATEFLALACYLGHDPRTLDLDI